MASPEHSPGDAKNTGAAVLCAQNSLTFAASHSPLLQDSPVACQSHFIARTLVALMAAALLASCASPRNLVITDGPTEAARSAQESQKVADEYRRGGAPEAARQAQTRADAQRAAAAKKHDGFLEWLVDTLFHTWLFSGK